MGTDWDRAVEAAMRKRGDEAKVVIETESPCTVEGREAGRRLMLEYLQTRDRAVETATGEHEGETTCPLHRIDNRPVVVDDALCPEHRAHFDRNARPIRYWLDPNQETRV